MLPLDKWFDPPMGVFSHGQVNTDDKLSLSRNSWDGIAKSKAEVPWLFKVSHMNGKWFEWVYHAEECHPATSPDRRR